MTTGVALLLACLVSQPVAPDPPDPTKTVKLEDLPPPLRLGVRAETVRRRTPVIPAVVLVPGGDSYIDAIGHWSVRGRFPVLIEDGSRGSTEDIARFVRAFKPDRVVRWDPRKGAGAARPNPDARKLAIANAVAQGWEAADPTPEAIREQWKKLGFVPPGIVVSGPLDSAWPAAAALAAFRGQPILWTSIGRGVDNVMPREAADRLAAEIAQACRDSGYSWQVIGDDLDAITLCLNCPAKVELRAKEHVATTDYLGRTLEASGPEGLSRTRFAWAAQVFGSEAESAYRAMCALFLEPTRAFLFDGYGDGDPWRQWDATAASKELARAGVETEVHDAPRQGEPHWRARCVTPVDAGLVLVNSSGERSTFKLEPGDCRSGDIPVLSVPAIINFVHSWSAVQPGRRETIAGRWLERGAYAYAGSVQEPYLQAFVPTPIVAARLRSLFPWGAVPRSDEGPVWKITVLGDPLITLGPPAPRATDPLPLEGAVDIDPAPGAQEVAAEVRSLVLLGRDSEAANRAVAALAGTVPPEAAAIMIPPLFRAGRVDAVFDAYALLTKDLAADPVLRDYLWLAAGPQVFTTRDERLIGLLRTNVREDQPARDAIELAPAIARTSGQEAATAFLQVVRGSTQNPGQQRELDEAMGLRPKRKP